MERVREEVTMFGNTEAVVAWTRDQFALSPNLTSRQKNKIEKRFAVWRQNPEPVVSLYLSIFNDCRYQVRYVMQSSHLPTFNPEAFRESEMYKRMVFWGVLYDLAHYKLTFNGKRYSDIPDRDLESYESVLFRVGHALCFEPDYQDLNSIKKLQLVNQFRDSAFSHEVHKKKRRG